jgi:hypothetical protein
MNNERAGKWEKNVITNPTFFEEGGGLYFFMAIGIQKLMSSSCNAKTTDGVINLPFMVEKDPGGYSTLLPTIDTILMPAKIIVGGLYRHVSRGKSAFVLSYCTSYLNLPPLNLNWGS